MTIKKNPNTGKYDVQVSARHPKTRMPRSLKRIGFETIAEATRVEKKMKEQLWLKMYNESSPIWDKFLVEYEDYIIKQDLTQKTKNGRIGDVRRYTMPTWSGVNIDKISEQMINQVMQSEDFLKKKQSRQKDILKHIRHALNYAWNKGYIVRNPTPKKKFKVGQKLLAVLTEDEVRLLLLEAKKVNHPWYYIWCVAFYTGMRNGELYALKWSEVKISTKKITVNCAWTRDGGFSVTKSGNDRIIEISKNLLPILEELKGITGASEFVLPRIHQWTNGAQAEVLRAFLKTCDLPSVRFHDIRATWATILLAKGISSLVVMKMGGWEDLDTMGRYIRKAGVDIKDATNVLEF